MKEYSWKIGGFAYKEDPNEVGKELESLGDNLTPENVVNKARNENSVLHGMFEWDDSVAASQYRLQQARHIITNIQVNIIADEEKLAKIFEKAVKDGAKFGFPTVGIKQSAISAAFRNGLAKNKVSIQGMFQIKGELAEITGNLKMREDYCKIPMAGADIVYRGEYDTGWKCTFTIVYDAGSISLEQIVQMINLGGFACGIGDWRVEKGGNFGTFHVE